MNNLYSFGPDLVVISISHLIVILKFSTAEAHMLPSRVPSLEWRLEKLNIAIRMMRNTI